MKLKRFNESEEIGEGVDLFETPELIPAEVKEILDRYDEETGGDEFSYEQLGKMHDEIEKVGYTFDYYLDAVPYDLRKIGELGKAEAWHQKDLRDAEEKKIKSFESFVNEELMAIDINIDHQNGFPGESPEEVEDTYGISCELNADGTSMHISGSRRNVLDYLDDYAIVTDIHGALIESEDSEECYIEFLNKDKKFQKDKKTFKNYQEAVKWAKENFNKFDPDMIKYSK